MNPVPLHLRSLEHAARRRATVRPRSSSTTTTWPGLLASTSTSSTRRALTKGSPSGRLRRIDLVISDVIVPGGSGPRLAETLRHRRPTLRVLYVSGFTWEAISEEGPPVREIDFLPKPFTASSLLARVRAVLDAR
jgi:DNA-binding response OmpR family regulator